MRKLFQDAMGKFEESDIIPANDDKEGSSQDLELKDLQVCTVEAIQHFRQQMIQYQLPSNEEDEECATPRLWGTSNSSFSMNKPETGSAYNNLSRSYSERFNQKRFDSIMRQSSKDSQITYEEMKVSDVSQSLMGTFTSRSRISRPTQKSQSKSFGNGVEENLQPKPDQSG